MLSNPQYSNDFYYIGAFVSEREKLIEVGFKAEDDHVIFEQSDMLMILLNLSYIPDEVVQKINFTPGWQKEFKANMEEYKKKFMREHEVEWQF